MSSQLFGTIPLRGATPLAEGMIRRIFQHPHDDRLLIKVMREERFSPGRFVQSVPWLRIRRRYGVYRTYTRQISEYLELRARFRGEPIPVERQEHQHAQGVIAESRQFHGIEPMAISSIKYIAL